MRNQFSAFFEDESGAVTVDWVVLTAAIAFMGIAVTSIVLWSGGPQGTTGQIENTMVNYTIKTTFD